MWRFQMWMPHAAEGIAPLIIGQNEENVWASLSVVILSLRECLRAMQCPQHHCNDRYAHLKSLQSIDSNLGGDS
jgi:hypothetical protein